MARTLDDIIRDFRTERPGSSYSDDQIIQLALYKARSSGTLESEPALAEFVRAEKVANTGYFEEFKRTATAGIDQMQAKLYDTAALAGDATGLDSLKAWGDEGRERNEAEAEPNAPTIPTFEDIRNPREFGLWLSGIVGSNAPQIAGTIAAGAAAAATAPAGAIGAGATGLAGLGVRAGMALGLGAGRTAAAGLGAKAVAALAGSSAMGFTQMQNYGELSELGGENVVSLAVANGLMGSVLEAAGPAAMLNKLVSTGVKRETAESWYKSFLKSGPGAVVNVALQAAKEGNKEMLTEMAQEALSMATEVISNRDNPDFVLDDDTIKSRLLNSGVAGFALGGVAGGVTAEVDRRNESRPRMSGAPGLDRAPLAEADLNVEIPPLRAPLAPEGAVPDLAATAATVADPITVPTKANVTPLDTLKADVVQKLQAIGFSATEAYAMPLAEAQLLIASAEKAEADKAAAGVTTSLVAPSAPGLRPNAVTQADAAAQIANAENDRLLAEAEEKRAVEEQAQIIQRNLDQEPLAVRAKQLRDQQAGVRNVDWSASRIDPTNLARALDPRIAGPTGMLPVDQVPAPGTVIPTEAALRRGPALLNLVKAAQKTPFPQAATLPKPVLQPPAPAAQPAPVATTTSQPAAVAPATPPPVKTTTPLGPVVDKPDETSTPLGPQTTSPAVATVDPSGTNVPPSINPPSAGAPLPEASKPVATDELLTPDRVTKFSPANRTKADEDKRNPFTLQSEITGKHTQFNTRRAIIVEGKDIEGLPTYAYVPVFRAGKDKIRREVLLSKSSLKNQTAVFKAVAEDYNALHPGAGMSAANVKVILVNGKNRESKETAARGVELDELAAKRGFRVKHSEVIDTWLEQTNQKILGIVEFKEKLQPGVVPISQETLATFLGTLRQNETRDVKPAIGETGRFGATKTAVFAPDTIIESTPDRSANPARAAEIKEEEELRAAAAKAASVPSPAPVNPPPAVDTTSTQAAPPAETPQPPPPEIRVKPPKEVAAEKKAAAKVIAPTKPDAPSKFPPLTHKSIRVGEVARVPSAGMGKLIKSLMGSLPGKDAEFEVTLDELRDDIVDSKTPERLGGGATILAHLLDKKLINSEALDVLWTEPTFKTAARAKEVREIIRQTLITAVADVKESYLAMLEAEDADSDVARRVSSPEEVLINNENALDRFSDLLRTAAARGYNIRLANVNRDSESKLLQDVGGATSRDPSNREIMLVLSSVLNPGQSAVLSAMHEIIHNELKQYPVWLQTLVHDAVNRIPLQERGYRKHARLGSADARIDDPNSNLQPEQRLEEMAVEHLVFHGLDMADARSIWQQIWRAMKDLFYRGAMYLQQLHLGKENTSGDLARVWAENLAARIAAGDFQAEGFMTQFGRKPTMGEITRLVPTGDGRVHKQTLDPNTMEANYPYSFGFNHSDVRYNIQSAFIGAMETATMTGLVDRADAETEMLEMLGGSATQTERAMGPLPTPTGKPSKLSPNQQRMVHTPEFKAWFGDWETDPANASKVIDPETGEPQIVYHGSRGNFKEFSEELLGVTTGAASAKKGFFFASNPDNAARYGAVNKMPTEFQKELDASLEADHAKRRELVARGAVVPEADGVEVLTVPAAKARGVQMVFSASPPPFVAVRGKEWIGLGNTQEEARKSGFDVLVRWGEIKVSKDSVELAKINERIRASETLSGSGGMTYPMFLNIRTPNERDDGGSRRAGFTEMISERPEGSDGVIIRNTTDPISTDVFVILKGTQAKSAIGNNGNFDGSNPDITQTIRPGESAEKIKTLHSNARAVALSRARVMSAAANQLTAIMRAQFDRVQKTAAPVPADLRAKLLALGLPQPAELDYPTFLHRHGLTDPDKLKQTLVEELTIAFKEHLGEKFDPKNPPFNLDITIDGLNEVEAKLADAELVILVTRAHAKAHATRAKIKQSYAELSEKEELRRAEIVNLDKNLIDYRATDALMRKGIRDLLNTLKKDLRRFDKVSQSTGALDAIISESEAGLDRQKLAQKYNDKLLDEIDLGEQLPLGAVMRALFRLEVDFDFDLATAPIKEIEDRVKEAVNNNRTSVLNALVTQGSGPHGQIKGTLLLRAVAAYAKTQSHIVETMRAQLYRATEGVDSLNELHSLLKETNEANLQEINAKLKENPLKSARLISTWVKEREKRLVQQLALAEYRRDLVFIDSSVAALADLQERSRNQIEVSIEWLMAPGARIPTPVSPEATDAEVLDPKNSTVLPTDRRASATYRETMLNVLKKQRAWLDAREASKDVQTVTYRTMRMVYAKLREEAILLNAPTQVTAGIVKSASGVGAAAFMRESGTQSGLLAARKWNRFLELQRSWAGGDIAKGQAVNNAKAAFLAAAKLNSTAADDGYRRFFLDFMGSRPDLTEAEGFAIMKARFTEDSARTGIFRDPKTWDLFAAWMRAERDANLYQSDKIGAKVRDEKMMVVNPLTGREEAVLRSALDRGIKGWTFPRKIHYAFEAFMKTFPSTHAWLGDAKEGPFGAISLKTKTEQGRAELSAALAETVTDDLVNTFLNPLIERSDGYSTMPVPENEAGIKLPVDPMLVRSIWRSAEVDGDLLKLADKIFEARAIDPTDTDAKNEYAAEVLGWVQNTFRGVWVDVNPKHTGVGIQGLAHVAIDSRRGDNYPSEWLDFHGMTVDDLSSSSHLIAANEAFGRDFQELFALYKGVEDELTAMTRGLPQGYEERADLRKADPKGYANMVAAEKLLRSHNQKRMIGVTEGIFSPDNVGVEAMGLLPEIYSLGITILLSGLKSALKQLTSPLDTFLVEKSFSAKSIATSAKSVSGMAQEFLGSMASVFGINLYKNDARRELILGTGLFSPGRDRTMKENLTGGSGRDNNLERTWSGRAQMKLRKARLLIANTKLAPREGMNAVPFTPISMFGYANTISGLSTTSAFLDRAEELAIRGAEFYRANPERVGTTFTAKEIDYPDADGYNNLIEAFSEAGISMELLAEKAMKMQETGGSVVDNDLAVKVGNMVLTRVTGEGGPNTRPVWMQTSKWMRMVGALNGWSLWKTAALVRLFEDPNGQHTRTSFFRGVKVFSLAMLPAAVAFSIMLDEYDEEVVGKKSNLRPLLGDDLLGSIIERGQTVGIFGLFGDVLNTAVNVRDGTVGTNTLSLDQRIVMVNSMLGLLKTVADGRAMGGTDGTMPNYANFWRRVMQAGFMGGVLQNLEVANRVFNLEESNIPIVGDWAKAESGVVARINVGNWLRAYGRDNDIEVRAAGGGSTVNRVTPWLTNMTIAALKNDQEEFQIAWRKAIEAAAAEGKKDPMKYVQEGFASRHPLKSVFRIAPNTTEYAMMLSNLPKDGSAAVSEGVNLINMYGSMIGVKPFVGVTGKAASDIARVTRMLDNQPRARTTVDLATLRSEMAARRSMGEGDGL